MLRAAIAIVLLALPAQANDVRALVGHGGPVMGIARADQTVLTASFDYSVGVWSGDQPIWLEGHRAAVNTVIPLGPGRAASGSDDFTVRIWDLEAGTAVVLEGHEGKVMGLAASDEGILASAGWDGRIGLWDSAAGTHIAWIEGHDGPVNAVVFGAEGELYSASYDGSIRVWDLEGRSELRRIARHGFGINTLLLDEAAGWLVYGALDGGTRAIDPRDGRALADLTLDRRPILSMARTADGRWIAVGDGEGYVMLVDTTDWSIVQDIKLAEKGPVWALAFASGRDRLLVGGIDDTAYEVPLDNGALAPVLGLEVRSFLKAPSEMTNGERQFNRKCSVCHTLTGDGARKAGPSLEGLFGRPAGGLEGYSYSAALERADFVWSRETVDRLFELGPDLFTPGSKMPMQVIAGAGDRADLIDFLERMTGEGGE